MTYIARVYFAPAPEKGRKIIAATITPANIICVPEFSHDDITDVKGAEFPDVATATTYLAAWLTGLQS